MTTKESDVEERTDLQITVCRNGVVNVHNPEYDRGHTYSVFVENGSVVRCSCKGHTYHGHCYHADEVESRPLITSSAQSLAESYSPVAVDGGLPEITHHREPKKVGGERYARCEGCGSESIFGANSILHDDDCLRAEADDSSPETEGYVEPTRSEQPNMGGGESTGVVDLE